MVGPGNQSDYARLQVLLRELSVSESAPAPTAAVGSTTDARTRGKKSSAKSQPPVAPPPSDKSVAAATHERILPEFLQLGLRYFIEGEAARLTCWWCNPSLRPLLTQLLHLHSLPADSVPGLAKFQATVAAQLLQCTACIQCYTDAKAEYHTQCDRRYPPEAVATFFRQLFYDDLARVWQAAFNLADQQLNLFVAGTPTVLTPPTQWRPTTPGAQPFGGLQPQAQLGVAPPIPEPTALPSGPALPFEVICIVYEILQNPWFLTHPPVNGLFCLLLRVILDQKTLEVGEHLMPALLVLLFHPWEYVRHWAYGAMRSTPRSVGALQWQALSGLADMVIDHLTTVFITDDEAHFGALRPSDFLKPQPVTHRLAWAVKALRLILLQVEPTVRSAYLRQNTRNAGAAHLPYLVTALLTVNSHTLYYEALRLLVPLLEAFGPQFWDHRPVRARSGLPLRRAPLVDFYPYRMISTVLQHPYFENAMRETGPAAAAAADSGVSGADDGDHLAGSKTEPSALTLIPPSEEDRLVVAERRLQATFDWLVPYVRAARADDQAAGLWTLVFKKTSTWAATLYAYPKENCLISGRVLVELLTEYYVGGIRPPGSDDQADRGMLAAHHTRPSAQARTPPPPSVSLALLPWITANGVQVVDLLIELSKHAHTLPAAITAAEAILQRDVDFIRHFVDELIALQRALTDPSQPDPLAASETGGFVAAYPYLAAAPEYALARTVWMSCLQGTLPTPLHLRILFAVSEVLWCDYGSLLDQARTTLTENGGAMTQPFQQAVRDRCLQNLAVVQDVIESFGPLATRMFQRMTANQTHARRSLLGSVSGDPLSSAAVGGDTVTDLLARPGIMALLRLLFANHTTLRLAVLTWIQDSITHSPALERTLRDLPFLWGESEFIARLVAYAPEDSVVCIADIMDSYRRGVDTGYELCQITARLTKVLAVGMTTLRIMLEAVAKSPITPAQPSDGRSTAIFGGGDPVSVDRVRHSLPDLWLRTVDFLNLTGYQGFSWVERFSGDDVARVMHEVFETGRMLLAMFVPTFFPLTPLFADAQFHALQGQQLSNSLETTLRWLFVTDEKLRDAAFAQLVALLTLPVELGQVVGVARAEVEAAMAADDGFPDLVPLKDVGDVAVAYRFDPVVLGKIAKVARTEPGFMSYLGDDQKSELEMRLQAYLDELCYPLTSDLRPTASTTSAETSASVVASSSTSIARTGKMGRQSTLKAFVSAPTTSPLPASPTPTPARALSPILTTQPTKEQPAARSKSIATTTTVTPRTTVPFDTIVISDDDDDELFESMAALEGQQPTTPAPKSAVTLGSLTSKTQVQAAESMTRTSAEDYQRELDTFDDSDLDVDWTALDAGPAASSVGATSTFTTPAPRINATQSRPARIGSLITPMTPDTPGLIVQPRHQAPRRNVIEDSSPELSPLRPSWIQPPGARGASFLKEEAAARGSSLATTSGNHVHISGTGKGASSAAWRRRSTAQLSSSFFGGSKVEDDEEEGDEGRTPRQATSRGMGSARTRTSAGAGSLTRTATTAVAATKSSRGSGPNFPAGSLAPDTSAVRRASNGGGLLRPWKPAGPAKSSFVPHTVIVEAPGGGVTVSAPVIKKTVGNFRPTMAAANASRLSSLRSDFARERQALGVPPAARPTIPGRKPLPMTEIDHSRVKTDSASIVNGKTAAASTSTVSTSDSDSEADGDDSQGSRRQGLMGLLGATDSAAPSAITLSRTKSAAAPPVRRGIKLIDVIGDPNRPVDIKPVGKLIAVPSRYQQGATGPQGGQYPRARVTDLTSLHRRILSWSLRHMEQPAPGNPTAHSASLPSYPPGLHYRPSYQRVPDTFASETDYLECFEPLLLAETWMQIRHARDEARHNLNLWATLKARASVNDFQELTFELTVADAQNVMEGDLAILCEYRPEDGQPATRHPSQGNQTGPDSDLAPMTLGRLRPDHRTLLTKVHVTRTFKTYAQVSLWGWTGEDFANLQSLLYTGSRWRLWKLTQLTTMNREYLGLANLGGLSLMPAVLRSRIPAVPALPPTEVDECIRTYGVNRPQAQAVLTVKRRGNGFSLIQGPPGTGKTRTILALVGCLLGQVAEKSTAAGDDEFARNAVPIAIPTGPAGVHKVPRAVDSTGAGNDKLLICAPSNAAVDEIVKRIMDGVTGADGKPIYPRVVRIGVADSMNAQVRAVSLDQLVDDAIVGLNRAGGGASGAKPTGPADGQDAKDSKGTMGTVRAQMDQCIERQDAIHQEIKALIRQQDEIKAQVRAKAAERRPDLAEIERLEDSGKRLKRKQWELTTESNRERDRQTALLQGMETNRRQVRQQILRDTDILCCTLSGSGHETLQSMHCAFETVIIDEAAQSVELSCLIPLQYRCRRCILVGDPNQLPPTVISPEASNYLYNQSLFVRLQKSNPGCVNLLSIQYRMHPEISRFPSRMFYNAQLLDGPDLRERKVAVWHVDPAGGGGGDGAGGRIPRFAPFRFYHVAHGREQSAGNKSLVNHAEAEALCDFVAGLCRTFPRETFAHRIGVITPYKQQMFRLRQLFEQRFGPRVRQTVDFNTVDGFQGQEKDIILFSCVRSQPKGNGGGGGGGIGFLADLRRMNVAMTRARLSLFMFGNGAYLTRHPVWRLLVESAQEHKAYITFQSASLFGQLPSKGTAYPNLVPAPTLISPARNIHPRRSLTETPGNGDGTPVPAVPVAKSKLAAKKAAKRARGNVFKMETSSDSEMSSGDEVDRSNKTDTLQVHHEPAALPPETLVNPETDRKRARAEPLDVAHYPDIDHLVRRADRNETLDAPLPPINAGASSSPPSPPLTDDTTNENGGAPPPPKPTATTIGNRKRAASPQRVRLADEPPTKQSARAPPPKAANAGKGRDLLSQVISSAVGDTKQRARLPSINPGGHGTNRPGPRPVDSTKPTQRPTPPPPSATVPPGISPASPPDCTGLSPSSSRRRRRKAQRRSTDSSTAPSADPAGTAKDKVMGTMTHSGVNQAAGKASPALDTSNGVSRPFVTDPRLVPIQKRAAPPGQGGAPARKKPNLFIQAKRKPAARP
ncbi:DEAD-box type RNA helicase [Tieghemiomyces parasiticus]|uniref:DEAD-box type RNA helicase n=1 Tax=Tieghemiomyces parasiticus TaxID=78921 RepID=A0A9W8DYJ7_9FUNG|nr:DEAD-box type RNA helicase [Tieghemiomyces parasiticus]